MHRSPSEVVWVTSVEIVTVYPSGPAATAFSSSSIPSASLVSSMVDDHVQSAVLSGASSAMPTTAMPPSSHVASHTSISPLHSGTSAPHAHVEPKGWKKGEFDLAAAFLTIIILAILFLLSVIGYGLFLRLRKGKCSPECEDMKAELAKYKSGELKYITIGMVKTREALNEKTSASASALSTSDVDLERGTAFDDQHPAAPKPSFWARVKGKITRTTKRPQSVWPGSVKNNSTVTVGSTPYDQSHQGQEPAMPVPIHDQFTSGFVEHFYQGSSPAGPSRRPSSLPSIYSQNSNRISTYHGNQSEDPFKYDRQSAYLGVARPVSTASSALNIRDPRHQTRYNAAQEVIAHPDAPDHVIQQAINDLNAVEVQMREKVRYGGYGGLAHPDDIPLANLAPVAGKGKERDV